MIPRPALFNSGQVFVNGESIQYDDWQDAHSLSGGQFDVWWDAAGIVSGAFCVTRPNGAEKVWFDYTALSNYTTQSWFHCGRGAVFRDFGFANIEASAILLDPTSYKQGGPMVAVNPAANEFGVVMYYEHNWYGGPAWILEVIGRKPTDYYGPPGQSHYVAVASSAYSSYTGATPVKLTAKVVGSQIYGLADDIQVLSGPLPASLVGSTLHGIELDVGMWNQFSGGGPDTPITPNLPCISSVTFTQL